MRLEGDDVVVHKKALQSCLSLCVVTLSQPRHSWRLHALWREFSVRALGAVVAGKLTQATEIPRWPEASTGGTAYVLHIDHLDPKDAKRPWLSKTREEDKVGDFGESRGLNPQKRVLRYEVLRALASCIVEFINFSDHETYRHELQRVRM
ncbi:hypothetical protein E4U25_006863 [Claviceps purpurea]|nr:hypothetical protein E4U25_006863 [Claviceps purpurea]